MPFETLPIPTKKFTDAVADGSVTVTGLGGGATNLNALTDVTLTAPTPGQVLKWDGTTSQWTNQADATAGTGGSGTVTSVGVALSNGFDGTVANANAGAVITLKTSVTGILKGNGIGLSAAIAGTDYANASHAHAASDITSGLFSSARLASGAAADGYTIKSVAGTPTWAVSTSTGTSTGSYMPIVSLASYTTDPTATVANTTAIQNWLNYLRDNKGTVGYIPSGIWQTNAGLVIHQGTTILGGGQRTTGIKLMNPGVLFTIQHNEADLVDPQYKNINLSNFKLISSSNLSTTLLLLTGLNPMFNLYFDKMWFEYGTYGVNYNPSTGAEMEIENLRFDDCIFNLCTTSYRCNSVNNSVLFNNCFQYMPTGGTAFDIQYCGKLTILDNHCTANQSTGKTDGILTNDGSTFLRLSYSTNCISIQNCQDENVEYFLYKQGNSYYPSRVSAQSCAIQGKIVFAKGMNFISENNIYVSLENSTYDPNTGVVTYPASPAPRVNSYIFRDVGASADGTIPASSGGVIYSNNDYFENRTYSQAILPTHTASAFTTENSYFATRRDAINTFGATGTTHQNLPLEISYFAAKSTETTPISTPAFANPGQSLLRIGDNNTSKNLLQLGSWNGSSFYGHTFFRDSGSGRLTIQGNQTGVFSEVWCQPSLIVGTNSTRGVIIHSPNGSKRRLTVSDLGEVSSVAA